MHLMMNSWATELMSWAIIESEEAGLLLLGPRVVSNDVGGAEDLETA